MQLLHPLTCRHMWPAAIWAESGRTGVLCSSLTGLDRGQSSMHRMASPVNLLAESAFGVSQPASDLTQLR